MIAKNLIETIYCAASIQRWNDHARPVEFTELDKQAHKMIIAWVIAKFEEDAREKEPIDWLALIEGGIFEFLHRITLTDIKPAIFHELMYQKGDELNAWVMHKLHDDIAPVGGAFEDKFKKYLSDEAYARREKRILKAAHYIATNWEFRILYNLNSTIYGIENTREMIENQIEDHYDLIGVQKISLGKKSHGFLDLCGQLRFQQRWAQLPRMPRTSVLGHMLVVAVLSYLVSVERGLSRCRAVNNFYAALFHDLPEVLTRDIVHPIKMSVSGLDEIIRGYEKKQINEKILPLLPPSWHRDMRYFIENEFSNRALDGNNVEIIEGEIPAARDREETMPVDGRLIEVCDKLAAYVEAALSLTMGLQSDRMKESKEKLYLDFAPRTAAGYVFRPIFDAFR